MPAAASVPRQLSSNFADGIGAGPVFAVGPMDWGTVSLRYDHAIAQGWPVKELWVINPRHTGPVTLSGHNLVTGTPLVFSFSGGPASPSPTRPKLKGSPLGAAGSGIWAQDPSYVVFPEAGCYTVSAKWSDGSWQVTEAVGYGPAVVASPDLSQTEARHLAVVAADRTGTGNRVVSTNLETLAAANASGGIQLSTRGNPPTEGVWMIWLKGRRDEGSCIISPPVFGLPKPTVSCAVTVRPSARD